MNMSMITAIDMELLDERRPYAEEKDRRFSELIQDASLRIVSSAMHQ